MSKDKSMTRLDRNVLSGILLSICKGIYGKRSELGKKNICQSQPRKSLRRGPVLARQWTMITITVVYFIIITLLLILDSPEKFLSNFIATESSLHDFARTYETVIHFFSFYLLAVLVCFCFRNISFFVAISFMVAYAVVTELAQISQPHRNSDVFDLLANLTGIGCGLASVWVISRIKNSMSRY